MHTLSASQQVSLIEIVNELHGSHLESAEFAEVVLGLFEDIPGLEAISQHKAKQFVQLLWRKYRGKEARER
jgi:hypothetical protein